MELFQEVLVNLQDGVPSLGYFRRLIYHNIWDNTDPLVRSVVLLARVKSVVLLARVKHCGPWLLHQVLPAL